MEWLCALSIFLSIWGAFITKTIENDLTKQYMYLIIPAPLIFLIIFGVNTINYFKYNVFIVFSHRFTLHLLCCIVYLRLIIVKQPPLNLKR